MQTILLFISVFLTGTAQLLFRFGMKTFVFHNGKELCLFIFTNPWIRGGVMCMGIGGVLWLYSLSKLEVSFAYPFVACSFILVVLGGYFL
jgi:drug/metabolite transporter (DMT)-like permease